MPFVPRGHVPLAPVVQRLFEQFTTDATAGYERARQERQQFIKQQKVPPDPSGSPMPLGEPQDSSGDAICREKQLAYIHEIDRYLRQIWAIKQIIVNVLQQDLGMGDTRATSLFPNGDILDIPARSWRTKIGEQAVVSGYISWADPGMGMTPPSEVFVADAVIERWIGMLNAAVRDMVDETASIDTTSGKLPMTLGPAGDKGRERVLVNRRVHIPPETANKWMFDAATAAEAAGEDFGRDHGVKRCQAGLNCTREVARAAYMALPDTLKQPRGKAIRKSA